MTREDKVRAVLSEAWEVIDSVLYDEVGEEKMEVVRKWLAGEKE